MSGTVVGDGGGLNLFLVTFGLEAKFASSLVPLSYVLSTAFCK